MIETRRTVTSILLVQILLCAASMSEEALASDRAPANVQAAIFMKVLAYDENIQSRAPEGLNFGIVCGSGETMGTELMEKLQSMDPAKRPLKEGAFSVSGIELAEGTDLAADLQAANIDFLYVCPGFDEDLPSIVAACRELGIGSLTAVESYVRSGVAVGVVLRDGKPKILVNIAGSKESGLDFDARLLQLAELIK